MGPVAVPVPIPPRRVRPVGCDVGRVLCCGESLSTSDAPGLGLVATFRQHNYPAQVQ